MRNRQTFEMKLKTRDPKTQKAYEITLNSFEGWLNGREITLENAEDIVQEYINWFNESHSPNTVWNYYSRIKKYLKHLKINIDEIELPAKLEKELYPLKLSDMHIIFQSIRYDDQTLFGCQACAGLRIGEAVQLQKKDFVWVADRLVIKIPAHKAKFKKARTTVLTKEMSGRVNQILKRKSEDDLVFGTTKNVHSSEVNKEDILRRALQRTGLDFKYDDTGRYQINTHSFRAFFITQVSRHDPNLAKKMAGEKGYLLQYDRLDDREYVDYSKRWEADLTIFDLAKKDKMHDNQIIKLREEFDKMEHKVEELERIIMYKNRDIAIYRSQKDLDNPRLS